jgi:hypothetical protein
MIMPQLPGDCRPILPEVVNSPSRPRPAGPFGLWRTRCIDSSRRGRYTAHAPRESSLEGKESAPDLQTALDGGERLRSGHHGDRHQLYRILSRSRLARVCVGLGSRLPFKRA